MTLSQTLFSFKGRINRAKWWLMQLLDNSCQYCRGYDLFCGLSDEMLYNALILLYGICCHLDLT